MLTGKINHIGEIFGNLEVIGEAEGYKQPSGKFVKRVLCKCTCGTEKIIVYKDLKKGDTKSCGCYKNSFKNDIVKNNVYGLLTIIGEVEKYTSPKGAKTRRVVCECACGKKKEYILQTLNAGKTKDCGCVFKKEVTCKRKLKEENTVKKEVLPTPEDTEEEQWKELIISSDYLVSTLGRIFSVKSNEYLNINKTSITLGINKIRKEFNIAKLVYETFIEKIDTAQTDDSEQREKEDIRLFFCLHTLRTRVASSQASLVGPNAEATARTLCFRLIFFTIKGRMRRNRQGVQGHSTENQ